MLRTLAEARAMILGRAEPGDAIEVPLPEAVGLVLAEPAVADVDMPPFDRADRGGFALRAGDAAPGALLRLVGREAEVGPDEASPVAPGDPMPPGADAVLAIDDARPDSPRVVEVLRVPAPGAGVRRRGDDLRAGTVLFPTGTRVRPPMVGLLASQGVIHPVCHRRVRVAVLAVGDHLVGPGEAPVMHRERDAGGPSVVAPCLQRGASAHDLGTVAEADLESALARALTAPVAVVIGPREGAIPRALSRAGVEPLLSGLSLTPGGRTSYGVVFGPSGRVAHHVFHLPTGPVAALTVTTLLIAPLLARLQGGPIDPIPGPLALWSGPPDARPSAVPVTLRNDRGRLLAEPVPMRDEEDVIGLSRADALALLPASRGLVAVAPLGPWPVD